MASSFQSFLNTYAKKDKKITQKDIKDYASKGGSKKKAQAWIDKINKDTKATKGIKVGSNVNIKDDLFKSFTPKSSPTALTSTSDFSTGSSSTSTPTGGSSGYSGTDIDLGVYEQMAGIDYKYNNLLQTDRLNNEKIIAGINADANEYLADAKKAMSFYSDDAAIERQRIASGAEERWRKYMSDQERAAAENVATIRGEYSLDLQNIVNAGLKDVETVRGEYGIQSDKVRGEYGLEAERIKGATARDVAQRQKEATLFGSLMQGFW